MLSIDRTQAAVVACHALPRALDTLPPIAASHVCRVAPDELLVVGPPALRSEIERRASEHFAAADPTALVLDQSDGWSTFTLRGDAADAVLAQLSAVPFPAHRPAFVQGAVAGGSAKILFVDGAIHVIVPSTLRQYVTSRFDDVCRGRCAVTASEVPFASDAARPSSRNDAASAALR